MNMAHEFVLVEVKHIDMYHFTIYEGKFEDANQAKNGYPPMHIYANLSDFDGTTYEESPVRIYAHSYTEMYDAASYELVALEADKMLCEHLRSAILTHQGKNMLPIGAAERPMSYNLDWFSALGVLPWDRLKESHAHLHNQAIDCFSIYDAMICAREVMFAVNPYKGSDSVDDLETQKRAFHSLLEFARATYPTRATENDALANAVAAFDDLEMDDSDPNEQWDDEYDDEYPTGWVLPWKDNEASYRVYRTFGDPFDYMIELLTQRAELISKELGLELGHQITTPDDLFEAADAIPVDLFRFCTNNYWGRVDIGVSDAYYECVSGDIEDTYSLRARMHDAFVGTLRPGGIDFSFVYNVGNGDVRLECIYSSDIKNGICKASCILPLSPREEKALVEGIEAHCLRQTGLSCLDLVNTTRRMNKLPPIASFVTVN